MSATPGLAHTPPALYAQLSPPAAGNRAPGPRFHLPGVMPARNFIEGAPRNLRTIAARIPPVPPRPATISTSAPLVQTLSALSTHRRVTLSFLCLTAVAAFLRMPTAACLSAAATLSAGLYEGSISIAAASSVTMMFAVCALLSSFCAGPRVQWVVELIQIGALVAFSERFIPGFERTIFHAPLFLRPDATAFAPSYNIDKALATAAVLAFSKIPRISGATLSNRLISLSNISGATAGIITVMLLPALLTGFVRFDPAYPSLFPLWFIHNLLLVCIAEETLYRGLIPTFLVKILPPFLRSFWPVTLISTVAFGFAHAKGGPTLIVLASLAGIGYGCAAQRAGGLAGSILAHVALNTVHILLFTYPALRR